MSLLLDALKQAEENKKKVAGAAQVTSIPRDSAELTLEEQVVSVKVNVNVEAVPNSSVDLQVEPVSMEQEETVSVEAKVTEPLVKKKTPASAIKPASVDILSVGKKPVKNIGYKKLGALLVLLLFTGVASLFLIDQERYQQVPYKDQVAAQKAAMAKQLKPTKKEAVNTPVVAAVVDMADSKKLDSVALIQKPAQVASPDGNPSAIQIKTRRTSSSLTNKLSEAYAALVGNELGRAARLYNSVLQKRPNQVDALLGLANIESQTGQAQSARALYERVLRVDGANSIAQIGLLQTYNQQGAVQRQQVLEELVGKYSNNPEVHLALGHAFAEQLKWAAAQKSYFKAFSLNPNNTVYAYNLAVSLDRLEQYTAAKTYYQKTLNLNKQSAKPLSLERVNNRLTELSEVYE